MHEMGIANSVLEAVAKVMREHPGERATRVGLRIGKYVAVDPDSLRFCFEAVVRSLRLEPLELDIEWCLADELDLAYVELDEVPSAALEVLT